MFFTGQIANWTGTWVEWVAQGWLVLKLTQSGFALGLVTALAWSPILVFGPWAGVIVDRFEKRRVLLFTNVTSGLGALLLGIATVTGIVTLWMVVVIALLLGFITALDNPSRQTFTLEMVGRERLTNAVSLNTATFTIARVLGPAIGGLLIANVGIGECFLFNTLSFIPITIVLSRIKRDELREAERIERKPGQVREGFRYVASVPVLRVLLTVMAIVGTLQYNFQLLLPLLAKETFSGNAATLGLLGTMLGIGAHRFSNERGTRSTRAQCALGRRPFVGSVYAARRRGSCAVAGSDPDDSSWSSFDVVSRDHKLHAAAGVF
jgi:MFS family permease